MSAFLGPIHYWLYNKIQLQESLTEALLEDHKDFYLKLDSLCGAVERRPLEEVIDTGNIHGWLQGQITLVEGRFAIAVTTLLKEKEADINDLKKTAYCFGTTHPIEAQDAPAVFKALNDLLLDGMPCDRVNQVLEEDSCHVLWTQAIDLHRPHWDAVGGDPDNYYSLRMELVSGMLKKSGFTFNGENGNFLVKKQVD